MFDSSWSRGGTRRKSETVKIKEELRVGLKGFVLSTDVGADVGADVGPDVGGDVGANVEGRGTVVFVEVEAHFPNVTPK